MRAALGVLVAAVLLPAVSLGEGNGPFEGYDLPLTPSAGTNPFGGTPPVDKSRQQGFTQAAMSVGKMILDLFKNRKKGGGGGGGSSGGGSGSGAGAGGSGAGSDGGGGGGGDGSGGGGFGLDDAMDMAGQVAGAAGAGGADGTNGDGADGDGANGGGGANGANGANGGFGGRDGRSGGRGGGRDGANSLYDEYRAYGADAARTAGLAGANGGANGGANARGHKGDLHISVATDRATIHDGFQIQVNTNHGAHHDTAHYHHVRRSVKRRHKRVRHGHHDETAAERAEREFRFGYHGANGGSTTTSTTTSKTTVTAHHSTTLEQATQSSESKLTKEFNAIRASEGREPLPLPEVRSKRGSTNTGATASSTSSSSTSTHMMTGLKSTALAGFEDEELPKLNFKSPAEERMAKQAAAKRKTAAAEEKKAEAKEEKREREHEKKEIAAEESDEKKAVEEIEQVAGDGKKAKGNAAAPKAGPMEMHGITTQCFYCTQLTPITPLGPHHTGAWCATMADEKPLCASVQAAVQASFMSYAGMPGATPHGFALSVGSVCQNLCKAK